MFLLVFLVHLWARGHPASQLRVKHFDESFDQEKPHQCNQLWLGLSGRPQWLSSVCVSGLLSFMSTPRSRVKNDSPSFNFLAMPMTPLKNSVQKSRNYLTPLLLSTPHLPWVTSPKATDFSSFILCKVIQHKSWVLWVLPKVHLALKVSFLLKSFYFVLGVANWQCCDSFRWTAKGNKYTCILFPPSSLKGCFLSWDCSEDNMS